MLAEQRNKDIVLDRQGQSQDEYDRGRTGQFLLSAQISNNQKAGSETNHRTAQVMIKEPSLPIGNR